MSNFKINMSHFLCSLIIFLQLLWMQKRVFFPSSNGMVYNIIYYMKYIGAIVLFFYTISKKRDYDVIQVQKKYIRLFAPLFILIIVVEFITLCDGRIVDEFGVSYWTRALSYILNKICIFSEIACIYILCRKETIKCISNALIFDGLLIVSLVIVKCGIFETLKVFFAVFNLIPKNSAMKLLELHEITYCTGLCIIYYMFFYKNKTKSDIIRIILMIIIFILGGKRIAFIGIVVASLFSLIIRKSGLTIKGITIFGFIGVVVCILYIILLYKHNLLSYLKNGGVDVMGRDIIYNYFMDRTEFSVFSVGWGVAAVTKVTENMTRFAVGNMVNVKGLHNDILKMYIELGFWGCTVWCAFNLLYVPKKIYKKFGRKRATLYMSLIIFAFITYLTDNTENYPVFQTILFIIPLACSLEKEE